MLTTDDLITRFRNEVDDILRGLNAAGNDALWSNDEALVYAGEAVAQVASDTVSLYKTFDLPFYAADGGYARLPSSFEVIDINQVYLVNGKYRLDARNLVEGTRHGDDYGYTGADDGWENATGRPRYYSREFRPGYLRMYPAPVEDDTLRITAVIGALETVLGAPLPFQHPKDVRLLLLWMKYLAYGKKDVDTFDPAASSRYKSEYDAAALDRKYECQRIRRAPRPVQFSW